MNHVMYLYVNYAKATVIKDDEYKRVNGWVCVGRFKDGTDNDLQVMDNLIADYIASGYTVAK